MELTIEQALQRGVTAHKEGRLQDAERLYRTILQSQPAHPDANHNLGVLAVSVNKIAPALPLFQTAVEANPRIEQFWLSYIDALIREQHFEIARKILEQAKNQDFSGGGLNVLETKLTSIIKQGSFSRLSPSQDQLSNLSEYYKKGRFADTEKLAISITQEFPKHPFGWKVLGAVLGQTGRYFEAVNANQTAVALSPQDAESHNNLGSMLKELGRLDEAEASYNDAIALKPDLVKAHSNLGSTLKELGRLNEAEASYNQAITLKPDFADAHYNLGNTLKDQGRAEESVSSYQQAFANRTGIHPVGDNALAPATTSIYFELTNKCNFHCTFCPSDSQKRSLGSMDLELVKQLYEENADKRIADIVNLHLMGEPTLHPALIEILKFGESKNVKTDLVTNISTLVAKNIPKILDALYGTLTASHMTPTEETYRFRGEVGLSWDRYISNLRLLVREYMKRLAKGNALKNNIIIRVMVTQNTASNVSVIETSNEARAILKEWNDFVSEVEKELEMTPFQRKDHNADDLILENNHAATSYWLQQGIKLTLWPAFTFANTRVGEDFDLKPTGQTSYCPHPFTDVGVLWNGDVTLCCLDHDGQLKVGNVRESSMETVIHSEAAQKLRASMLGKYSLPSICRTCQERPVKREKA
jgi:radical SAM protein with 4Fe4S-binding SPASM domain